MIPVSKFIHLKAIGNQLSAISQKKQTAEHY